MNSQAPPRFGHRQILGVAVPVMLSNLSVPLVGLVDTAVVGQLHDAYHIGAVAIGALIFDFVFWAFGFLRMGTSGFIAQAEGRGDTQALRDTLGRALLIALAASAALVILQPVIAAVAFHLVDGSVEVETHARTYFDIRIWSAPAVLANYALYGVLIGQGRSKAVLAFVLLLNGANIGLDAFFVLVAGMAADGVALGTLIAEYLGAGAAAWLVFNNLNRRSGVWSFKRLIEAAALRRLMSVNFDILIRSMFLTLSFAWFTAQSAEAGDIVLAANTVLLNIVVLSTYLLDGFSFAAESLVGRSIGAGDRQRFWQSVRLSAIWAGVLSLVLALAFLVFGDLLIRILTVNPEVRTLAHNYLWWAVITPVVSVGCFLLDGIFIGATQTRDMRNMTFLAAAVYFAAWFMLVPALDNHGRWLSLTVLYIARGVALAARLPVLARRISPNS